MPKRSNASGTVPIGSTVIMEELDYFDSMPMQLAVKREYVRKIISSNAIQHGAPIDFVVKNDQGIFSALYRSKLEVKVKITKADGTNLANDEFVGPVNNLLHSMFSNIEMEINGKTVTDATNLYPFKAHLMTVLNTSPDTLTMRGISQGYQRDTVGQVEVYSAAANSNNVGHREREARFHQSASITLSGRPFVDLFQVKKLIPDNTTLTLRLYPAPDRFVLMTAEAGAAHLLEIESARFLVYTYEMSEGVTAAIQQMMKAQTIRIPYNRVSVNTRTIERGVTNVDITAVYPTTLPDRLVMVMVNNAHANGTYASNPFNYQHFNVSNLSLKVDAEEIPYEGYRTNFPNDYTDAYGKVLEMLGLDTENVAIDITPQIWSQGLTFWVFKISPGPIDGALSRQRTGNAVLSITFAQATSAPINCILLSEYNAMLEIDDQRNVILH